MGLPVYGPEYLLSYDGVVVISVAYEPQTIVKYLSELGIKNQYHII